MLRYGIKTCFGIVLCVCGGIVSYTERMCFTKKKHTRKQVSVLADTIVKCSSALDQRLVYFELDTCILGYVLTWDCFNSNCLLRKTK